MDCEAFQRLKENVSGNDDYGLIIHCISYELLDCISGVKSSVKLMSVINDSLLNDFHLEIQSIEEACSDIVVIVNEVFHRTLALRLLKQKE